MYGYRGKLLRINLSDNNVIVENIPIGLYKKYLGGRGVAAKIYYDEIPPNINPLMPENKIILFTGPFTGTPIFSSSKIVLTTKSPLTGVYLTTNAGGYFGAELKSAGYDGLIIEGKATQPSYISIMDGDIKIKPAVEIWGKSAFESQKYVKEEMGDKRTHVISIGAAGERYVKFASIMCDDRFFGRGGAGAVMASKKLKAIGVRGSASIELACPNELKSKLKEAIPLLKETTHNHTKLGTHHYMEIIYDLGAYPLFNFQKTTSKDMDNLINEIYTRNAVSTRCFACPVACGKLFEITKGEYKGLKVRPEYETVWSLGPHCGIFDFDNILTLNYICNHYGVDSITAGYMIGFAMELYSRGILTNKDLDGLKLEFGDCEAAAKILKMVCEREGIGNILAEGSRSASEIIGKGTSYYALHVKGMELTAYEPRAFHGMALTYATSSRGACHNVGGWTIRDELIKKTVDRYAIIGKGTLVKKLQDLRAYIDSLGVCTIPRRSLGLTEEASGDLISLTTGVSFEALMHIGERIYNLERLILNREGISRKDDSIPQRLKIEPLPDGMAKGHKIAEQDFSEMLNEYYLERGWSVDGKVTKKTAKQFEIP